MDASRKAAIQAYKERKTPRGVFAIYCDAISTVWIDSAMDLAAAKNRIWFTLRNGDRQLDQQIFAEFQAHGEQTFRFEVVEQLEDDVAPMALRDLLKERKRHWLAELNARSLSPM